MVRCLIIDDSRGFLRAARVLLEREGLIVVGVAMDTVQQLEAQLVMRNYDGFVRKGRVRGRRN